LSAGNGHVVALNGSGFAVGWGNDWQGQVTGPSWRTDIVSLACGSDLTLGLSANGKVYAWGWDIYGVLDVPTSLGDVVSIAAGNRFALATDSEGKLVAWGESSSGQTTVPAGLGPVIMADGGYSHTVALVSESPITRVWSSNIGGIVGMPMAASVVYSAAQTVSASFLPPGLSFDPLSATFTGTPEATGLFNSRVTGQYGNVLTTKIVQFNITMPRSFAEWTQIHFGSSSSALGGPSDDPDSDGIPNIVEFVLSKNPLVADSTTATATTLAIGNQRYLGLTYRRLKGVVDTDTAVEVSADMRSWKSGYPNTIVVSVVDDGDTETITVRDSEPMSLAPHRFIRLRITKSSN
jgi:hypothetical protein